MKFSDVRKIHTNIQLFVHTKFACSWRLLNRVYNFLVTRPNFAIRFPSALVLSPKNRVPSSVELRSLR